MAALRSVGVLTFAILQTLDDIVVARSSIGAAATSIMALATTIGTGTIVRT
jgi:hypothetical protein